MVWVLREDGKREIAAFEASSCATSRQGRLCCRHGWLHRGSANCSRWPGTISPRHRTNIFHIEKPRWNTLPNGITMCANIGIKWQHTGLLYLHQLRHNDWSHLVRPLNLPLYIDAHLIGTVLRSSLSGNIIQSIPCFPKIKV